MAPEESLYVIFSGTAGERPGFWYENSWGACNRMLLHKNVLGGVCNGNVNSLGVGVLPLSCVLFMLTEWLNRPQPIFPFVFPTPLQAPSWPCVSLPINATD